MMTTHHNQPIPSQRGAITILISIVMLLLVTLIVLTTSKTVLMEQKIASNMFRSEQSLEAAETGIQQALNYISGGPNWGIIQALTIGSAFNIFDLDTNGTVDSNTGTLPDGSSYTLVLGANSDMGADPVIIEIVATGTSSDGAATKTVTRIIRFIDPLPYPLDNSLLSGGGATLSGSAKVHNPQGHSTIWSGDSVDTGSNTFIADPSDAGYPLCLETPMSCVLVISSTDTLTGLDVIEQDSSLAGLSDAQFFENFFGYSKEYYKNNITTLEVSADHINNEWDDADEPGVDHAQNEIIWVSSGTEASGSYARLGSNTVSGCITSATAKDNYDNATCIGGADDFTERKPSTIIVEGDLRIVGGFHHYGILFVTGDIFGGGSARIEGALVVGGTSRTSGTLDIWFNTEMVRRSGEGNNSGGSDGGWRDF